MFLSVSAVCAEDSASLDLNETNIDIETPVSTSTDVVADEQEVCEYSSEDVVYASEIGLNESSSIDIDLNSFKISYSGEIIPSESSSNDIDLSSFKISYSGEITDGPVKAPNAGAIYVNPTTGDDNNAGTSWSSAVKTITGALNLVADGGTIYLAEGEHTERASITKNVTLIGQSRDKTILTKAQGSFLRIENATVKIYNCSFVNNTSGQGGAIYISSGNVIVDNCYFRDNAANQQVHAEGGGIYLNAGNLTVNNCFFINNYARLGGSSICALGSSGAENVNINDCYFTGESGGSRYSVLDLSASSHNIRNSYFIDNKCCAIEINTGNITGCVFMNNYGGSGTSHCGAIGAVNRVANPVVSNSVFVNNSGKDCNDIWAYSFYTATIEGNNWWGTNSPDWNSLVGGGAHAPNSYAVLNIAVEEIAPNMYNVIAKFCLNGTQTVVDIPTRDVEFRSSSEVIKGKMVNGVFKYIYTLNIGDEKDISIVVDNEVQNITLVGHLLTPDISVIVNDIVFGDVLTIDALVPSDLSNNVIITVDGKEYSVSVVDGKVTKTIPDLATGAHIITVKYNGDEVYTSAEVTKTVNVAKADAKLDVIISDVDYCNVFVINAVLTGANNAPLTGDVIVKINGKEYTVKVTDGRGILSADYLDAGSYDFTARWVGNSNYNSISDSGKFNVNKINADMSGYAEDIKVGEDLTINVDLPYNATGNVIITVDGKDYTVAIKDGKVVKTISGLKAGSYVVTVRYDGDNNYNSASGEFTFNVNKVTTVGTVKVKNIVFGEELVVDMVLPSDATGTLTVEINGKEYTATIVNGKATLNIPGLNAGAYAIMIEYSGDDKYTRESVTDVVHVFKAQPTLDVVINDNDYGSSFIIDATLNGVTGITGDVIVNVNGKSYVVSVVNGRGILIADKLNTGLYTFTARFNGNDNYNATTDSGRFCIGKITPSFIDIDVDNIEVGEDATITVTLPDDATGNVVITVDNKNYTVAIKDGKAVQTISGLKAGEYTITVNYTGDNNYRTISNTTKLTVSKIYPNLYLVVDDIVFGEVLKIDAILPSDAKGLLIITVDNIAYRGYLIGGEFHADVYNLGAGHHDIIVEYEGDDKYSYYKIVTNGVDVDKATPSLNVIIEDVDYNNVFTIGATLTGVNGAKLTGDVTVTVNGKEYTVKVTDGRGTFVADKLSAGSYDFTANWAGNDNYTSVSDSGNFKVNKITPNVDISLDDIQVGEDLTITVSVPADATGSVVISVNGEDYIVAIKDGKAVKTISGLRAGEYNVTVNYDGDGNYNNASNTANFSVSKIDVNLDVIINDVDYGNVFVINAVLTDVNGAKLDALVFVTVNGVEYTVNIVNGKGTLEGVKLPAGSYTFKAVDTGSDTYNEKTDLGSFTVNKITPAMDINVDDIQVGEDATITVSVPAGVTGDVIITVNNKNYTVTIVDGKAVKTISGLRAGEYNVTVRYDGDNNYTSVSGNAKFSVSKVDVNLDVIISDIGYGNFFVINAVLTDVNNAKLNGLVFVTVNNFEYKVTIVNGKGTLEGIKLPAGSYTFKAVYAGSDTYSGKTDSGSFNVNKIVPNFDFSVDDIKVGEDATIKVTLPADATGSVIITVNNKNYTVAIVNGKAVQKISDLKAGNYDATVRYAGDSNYINFLSTVEFSVSKVDPTMDVVTGDIVFGDDLTISALLPSDINGDVIITVDGKEYTVTVVNGKATNTISDLTTGNHTIVVKYNGNDKYNSIEVTKTINVTKADPILNIVIDDINYNEIFTINAVLTGVNGAKLTDEVLIDVGGVNFAIKVVNGKGSVTGIKLPAGNYKFAASWKGNENYNLVKDSGNFTVNKIIPAMDIDVDDIQVGEDLTIAVSVPVDVAGSVVISVNGEDYIVAIKDGSAVKTVSGLKEGVYNVTVKYPGDNNYVNTSGTVGFSVSKVDPTMKVLIDDIVFGDDLIISALLPSDISGMVVISVDGKNYTAAVVNGKVYTTISGLNAGNHNIVIKYSGDHKYNPVEITKTVTVNKANPTLDVIIADIDYNNVFTIDATLTGVNNAKLTGDVIVTIGGKDYTVKVVDGKGTLSGIKLGAGSYAFSARFAGNDNYNSTSDSGDFKVNKIASTIGISVDDIQVGEDLTITVNVPSDAAGSVVVTVDGKDYTLAVVGGKATTIISGLKEGTYTINARYNGDNNYNDISTAAEFSVSKVNPVMDVVIGDIVFGDDALVNVNLPSDINGSVIISVDGVEKTVIVVNGKASESIKDLNTGNHTIKVKYTGNDKYNPVEFTKTINVAKADPTLNVVIDNVDYNTIFVINAVLTGVNGAKLTGDVIVTVNGKNYTVKIIDGKGTLNGVKLSAGVYDFTATWEGNENYNNVSDSDSFHVNKINSTMDVNVGDIKVDDDEIISVTVPSDATGDVIVTIDGKNYTGTIVDGKAVIKIAGLKAGNYTANIIYPGDNNYNNISTTAKFSVSKVNPVMDVVIGDIVFGENITVTGTLPGDINGTIVISVDGVNYTALVVNGKINKVISGLNAGTHTVIVKYAGNDKYNPVEVTKTVNVAKANPVLDVIIDNINYGEVFVIDATLTGVNGAKLTGDVIVTVNGKNYTVRIINGKGTLSGVQLPAGSYDFSAKFSGNSNYNAVSASGSFNVAKANSTLNVIIDDVKIDEDITIKATLTGINNAKLSGDVTVIINGKDYTVSVVNGEGKLTIAGLHNEGVYDFTATWKGDNNYMDASVAGKFNVSKVEEYPANITIPDGVEGKNSTISIDLPDDATGEIIVVIDGKNYTGNVSNGTGSVDIPPLDKGIHNITVIYPGDDKYDPVIKEGNITVDVNKDAILVVDDVLMIYHDGSKLTVLLKDFYGNPIVNATVTITINGMSYSRVTDEDGYAFLTLNLDSGDYVATVVYPGDDYYNGAEVNASVKIIHSILGENIVKMYQNGTQFFANFTDSHGNPLANTTVKFNINGVFYEKTTNGAGIARLNINLRPGEYILTAYNPVTGEQEGFNITVKAPISENHDIIKYYKNGTQYTAKVYNKDGTLAVGKNVTFNINGVFYNRVVDKNGMVTLAINLNPGKYIITAIFDGYAVGNNVTVKNVLLTKDLSMKHRDGSKFNATVLDGQGKPLANVTVTFNVNGVFYNRTTDSNGVASLAINLLSGEYIITSIWEGYQVGNKITIK